MTTKPIITDLTVQNINQAPDLALIASKLKGLSIETKNKITKIIKEMKEYESYINR